MKGQDEGLPVSARAAVVAFGLGMALVVLCVGLLSWGQHRLDQKRLEEGRALMVARVLSAVALSTQFQADAGLASVTTDIQKAVPGLTEAFVLKGTKFAIHTDPEKSNKGLNNKSLDDKALFDKSRRIQKAFADNQKALADNPQMGRKVADEQEVDGYQSPVVAAVPIIEENKVSAMSQVSLTPVGLAGAVPWTTLLLTGLAAVVLFGVLRSLTTARLAHAAAILSGVGAIFWMLGAIQNQQSLEYFGSVQQRQTLADSLVKVFRTAGREISPRLLVAANVDQKEVPYNDLRLTEKGVEIDPGALEVVAVAHQRNLRIAGGVFLAGLMAIYFFVALGAWGRLVHIVRENSFAYAYTVPAMIGMVLLVFIPFAYGVVLGFMQRNYNVWTFVGFDNFWNILWDFDLKPRNFYYTLVVTVLWTVTNVTLHVTIGLGLALLLQDKFLKMKALYRVLLVIPWAVPNYITALIWQGMFHKEFGAVNHYLGYLGVEPISWFGSFWTAFAANLATNTWLGFPFMMVISLGALQSIPADLYEAAEVDGASWWQQFRRITLPLLKPALFPSIILGTIWTFNQFNIIYLVSAGQPANSTDILIVEAYRIAFENDNYGGAAAYSTIIFLILLLYTVVSNRWAKATAGAFD